MLGIITAVLPLALRLIGMFLDRAKADAETKKAFLEFTDRMQSKGMVSKSLHDSFASQLGELDAEVERLRKERADAAKPPSAQ